MTSSSEPVSPGPASRTPDYHTPPMPLLAGSSIDWLGRGVTRVPPYAGFALCLLLAVAQVALAGYQMGVGNQPIQIAFMKKWADPSLYANDVMVQQTMPYYPSFFFRALAPLLLAVDVSTLYLALQILTSFATLAAVYWLARNIYRSHTAALAAVAVLIAGHLTALAGDSLYSLGFTHTFVALPLAVLALALAYRGLWLAAFAVAGILFNIHALTSAYALLMLGAAMLADFKQIGFRAWIERAGLSALVTLTLAAPTLKLMLDTRQAFTADWVNLMHIRSADHSFPQSWWTTNNPDIPRFALLLALFVLSWSFTPVRRAVTGDAGELSTDGVRRASRMTMYMTLAVLGFFAIGYVFSEIKPVPLFIRLQPFRASRLLMILMLVHITHGAIAAIRAGLAGRAMATDGRPLQLAVGARAAEILAGLLIIATLAVPWLLQLLPFTVIIATAAAVAAGHLSWRQALVAAGALWIAVIAHLRIEFPLPLLASKMIPAASQAATDSTEVLGWLSLALAGGAALAIGFINKPPVRIGLTVLTTIAGAMLAGMVFARENMEQNEDRGPMAAVAAWVRQNTPRDTLFLAPKGLSSFRVEAERSMVGDWRDGTQLYFSSNFGPTWISRLRDIEPNIMINGNQMTARGDDLGTLKDDELIALANKYRPLDQVIYKDKSVVKGTIQSENAGSVTVALPAQVISRKDITQVFKGTPDEIIKTDRTMLKGEVVAENEETVSFSAFSTISKSDIAKLVRGAPLYILLKHGADERPRTLAAVYSDKDYSIYEPRYLSIATRPVPAGVINPVIWNESETFINTTVQQNIDKNRKANLALTIVDPDGRPIQELSVKLDQTKSPFAFGASLGFFKSETRSMPTAGRDQLPEVVRPIELEKMPEVFNGSMIPFSSKWAYLEPSPGKYYWDDLDAYVDYCNKHDITMEFHHLTGILPAWAPDQGAADGMTGLVFPKVDPNMQKIFNNHCLAVLDRYGEKIKYYQVVNEKYMMQYVPEAWKLLKADADDKKMKIQFGLSDCVNFYDSAGGVGGAGGRGGRSGGYASMAETKGIDAIQWLMGQGINPDFFSMHGHHPNNLWADPREMYSVIDRVAALGPPTMHIHISEEYLQLNGPITGPLRTGQLTPALHADYLCRYYTVLFSHPKVDMINLWGGLGLAGWTNTGLIDASGKPLPAFDALKKLFNETFRTHLTEETGLDGSLEARVFHGTYKATIQLEGGKEITATFEVPQEKEAKIHLVLDETEGTLKPAADK